MKRILVFIIALILASSIIAVSLAESFSVRNGIKFGMTADEVMELEKDNGGRIDIRTDEKTNAIDAIFYYDINIAGFDKGYVLYTFKDEKLIKIKYNWHMNYYSPANPYQPSDKTHVFSISAEDKVYAEHQKIYDTINETLASKYEVIGSYANGVFNHFDFDTEGNRGVYPYLFETGKGEYTDVYGITQYITQDDDNYVEVVNACCEQIYNNSREISVDVAYRFIPAEQYNSLQKDETPNNQEKLNSDL